MSLQLVKVLFEFLDDSIIEAESSPSTLQSVFQTFFIQASYSVSLDTDSAGCSVGIDVS